MSRVFTLSLSLLLSVSAWSQSKYTYDFTDTSLLHAVETLSKEHHIKFSYDANLLRKHSINLKLNANSKDELVSLLFRDTPFEIKNTRKVYLIIPQKENQIPTSSTLEGHIYDKTTGTPLPFANIISLSKSAYTDVDGRFSISTTQDSMRLMIRYVGYKNLDLQVASTSQHLSLFLEPTPYQLQEIILNSDNNIGTKDKVSFYSLNPQRFSALPALGETDVFKSLQLLPGIQATNESSAGLSVRGSTHAQNLVLLDGMTIYHLDHFFGIFSAMNSATIRNLNIYKGGFAPQYGGRTSSVVEATGRSGSKEALGGQVGINALSYNGLIESPIGEKTSVIIAGRKSSNQTVNSPLYDDFLSTSRDQYVESVDFGLAEFDTEPTLDFYDVYGKARHQFSNKSALDINTFISKDSYIGLITDDDSISLLTMNDESEINNLGLSSNWKYTITPNWFSSHTISYSKYKNEEEFNILQDFHDEDLYFRITPDSRNLRALSLDSKIENSVTDFTVKSHHEIDLDTINTVTFGAEVNLLETTFNYALDYDPLFADPAIVGDSIQKSSWIPSLYVNHELKLNALETNLGLRTSYYIKDNFFALEPRINLSYLLNNQITIRGSWSQHHQFINQATQPAFQYDGQRFWSLPNDNLPIQSAQHYILSSMYAQNNWQVNIEGYYKQTKGIVDSRFSLDQEGLAQYPSGKNDTYGIDLFVKYAKNKFSSWVSYSLSESEDSYDINDQTFSFPSSLDQRHEINWVNVYQTQHWEFSTSLIYGSGRPYAIPNPHSFNPSYDLEEINTHRIPSYLRADASAKYTFSINKLKFEAALTIFNLFNRTNISGRRFVPRYAFDRDSFVFPPRDIELMQFDNTLLGTTPNLSLNIFF